MAAPSVHVRAGVARTARPSCVVSASSGSDSVLIAARRLLGDDEPRMLVRIA
jgi:hypothetical protein